MVVKLNPIVSMILTMSFFGLLFTGIFIGIARLNALVKSIKLKRKLATVKLIAEGKKAK